jgi:hypothetical protein
MVRFIGLAFTSLLAAAGVAQAAEGGGSAYPNGAEGYTTAAVPPPGVYGLLYGTHYTADRLNDAQGNSLGVPGFKIRATSVVPRIGWVPGNKVLGGDLAFHAVLPITTLKVSAMGASQSKSGLGDITLGTALGYHHSPSLHTLWGLDAVLPTGSYKQTDLANIGRNYSAIDLTFAVSNIQPSGLNADLRLGYLINQKNDDTGVRSGNELHGDYAIGWGMGNGWTAGVGGYFRQQLSSDEAGGVKLANSKTSALAIGPAIKFDSGRGWFVTAKWQKEIDVENGAKGNAVWLKAVFPL